MKGQHESESKAISVVVVVVVVVVVEESWTRTGQMIIILRTSSAQLLWRERARKRGRGII